MKSRYIALLLLVILSLSIFLITVPIKAASEPLMTVGMIADVQYCHCKDKSYPDGSHRYYKSAPDKLKEAVHTFNQQRPDFVVDLGDTIDTDEHSFNTVTPIYNKIKSKRYHILGNHDFPVADYRAMRYLKMTNNYYSFSKKHFRFVFLDTNEISTYANPVGSPRYNEAKRLLKQLKNQGAPYAYDYNGGISKAQLKWFEHILAYAKQHKEKVIIYGHQPVYPKYDDNLLNRDAVIAVMEKYNNVVAYFNGHTHLGKYHIKDGVHYLNLKGLVETPDTNAYSIMTVYEDVIKIKGYGREPSRTLKLKQVY